MEFTETGKTAKLFLIFSRYQYIVSSKKKQLIDGILNVKNTVKVEFLLKSNLVVSKAGKVGERSDSLVLQIYVEKVAKPFSMTVAIISPHISTKHSLHYVPMKSVGLPIDLSTRNMN